GQIAVNLTRQCSATQQVLGSELKHRSVHSFSTMVSIWSAWLTLLAVRVSRQEPGRTSEHSISALACFRRPAIVSLRVRASCRRSEKSTRAGAVGRLGLNLRLLLRTVLDES